MAHRLLVSRRLVREVHGAGGQLYVWTVDDAEQIRRLEELGVDAVITNDPRSVRFRVTDRVPARSGHVNQATIQPLAALSTDTAAESFGDLYERTFDRVYAYVQSMLRDRAAAEDVTAQAFERAYRKRRSYRPRRGSAEAWLFGIARNAALDELRRRGRHARMATEPEDTGGGSRWTTWPRRPCAGRPFAPRWTRSSPASASWWR